MDKYSNVRFLSWNLKGLNGPIKRSKVFVHLKHLKPDITFLQETHLRLSDHARLRSNWVGQYFHSSLNSRSRGVAILIHKRLNFTVSDVNTDSKGRYVVVTGTLCQIPVILVSVYAPNWDDACFANNLLSSLPNLNTHRLILGGDLNCVMNPLLDRSSPRTHQQSAMSKAFSVFIQENGCVDPWRDKNPHAKKFSFFSNVHNTFSRIDYFFIDQFFLPAVESCDYTAIVISDHAAVLLDIHFSTCQKERPLWRFNSLLLSDKKFCTYISDSIDSFVSSNKTEGTSASLLWETLKAFLRGQIISYSISSNKDKRLKFDNICKAIADVDQSLASNPDPELCKKRLDLQSQANLLTTSTAEKLLLRSKGLYYEYGDKSSRLLAHQLRRQAAARLIPQITDSSGILKSTPSSINEAFVTFYTSLYKSEFPTDTSNMTTFLSNLDIPNVNLADAENIDKPLEISELIESIKLMQNNKTPGPDGYPSEFYKAFSAKLAPFLLDMYNESLANGSLPPTLTQATISLILKKGKDPTDCGSYRPISLLNVDSKILAKTLSARLEAILPDIISEEQTGFIQRRHSFSNVRKLFNIIYSSSPSNSPEAAIALDAEKAFDRVEWDYLFAILKKFGFGNTFISWIQLLYTSPKASICTNNFRSAYFPLTRGTRQGCPLSPLLFAIAIEPLSIALRTSQLFRGILRGDTEYRVSLYADDLLLYLSNPVSAVPHILSILRDFGSFSGYKLNYQKSEFYPVNNSANQITQAELPFHISASGFRYLGIQVTGSFSSLFSTNFTSLLDQVKSDLQRWDSLPLSLVGRIQSIKMTILPKFSYLFQCIPLFLPKSFFKSLNQTISTFIWRGKQPRIKSHILQRSRGDGGLALPNFMYYYWAANIQKITYWLHSPLTDWCLQEAKSCRSSSLPAIIYSKLPISPSKFTRNPVVIATIKIWTQFRLHFKFKHSSVNGPISNNHLFPPSTLDSAFLLWKDKGLIKFSDLFENNTFSSFEMICTKYNLPRSNLFRYFQIRNFVKTHYPSYPELPNDQPWEGLTTFTPGQKGLISNIYHSLTRFNMFPLIKNRNKWETELNESFPDEWWDGAIDRINTSTSCARLGLIQFKIFHRLHFCKSKLAAIYPDVEDKCDRCALSPANLTHMFWSCPRLEFFWTTIFEMLSEAFSVRLEPSPQIAIFGVPQNFRLLTTKDSNIVAFTTLLARRRILLGWKSPTPPSIAMWLTDIMHFLKLEKIKFTLRGSTKKFLLYWQPFITYFESLATLPTN